MELLFFFAGVWFWPIVLFGTILIIAALEAESGRMATFFLIASLAALHFLTPIDLVAWVKENPGTLAAIIAGYFVFGTVWSVFKWGLYVRENAHEHRESARQRLKQFGVERTSELTPEQREKFDSFGRYEPPQVVRHKATILMWMTYWPFSAAWFLISDPIRRTFQLIYYRIGDRLQAISNRIYRRVTADVLSDI